MSESRNQVEQKSSIALIGMRGAGKTTIGRELATMLGGNYVDTDELIVRHAGKSIAEIFATEGEEGFRRRERDAIVEVVAIRPKVIGVGGGAILDEENVRLLRSVATLVWLTAPPEVLRQRMTHDPNTPSFRPALTDRSGLAEIQHLLQVRTPYYQRAADVTIDTANEKPGVIAAAIMEKLKSRPPGTFTTKDYPHTE